MLREIIFSLRVLPVHRNACVSLRVSPEVPASLCLRSEEHDLERLGLGLLFTHAQSEPAAPWERGRDMLTAVERCLQVVVGVKRLATGPRGLKDRDDFAAFVGVVYYVGPLQSGFRPG